MNKNPVSDHYYLFSLISFVLSFFPFPCFFLLVKIQSSEIASFSNFFLFFPHWQRDSNSTHNLKVAIVSTFHYTRAPVEIASIYYLI